LREKVSAKLTDEGSSWRRRALARNIAIEAESVFNPSSDPFGATFSRKGRRMGC
jgi:hypothetical protein